MRPLNISQIWIYPIKSLGGIQIQYARVLPKGLEFDRRWMLVDETGRFMTQRVHPKMALFKLSLNGNHITVTFKSQRQEPVYSSVIIDGYAQALGKVVHATIWDDAVETVEVDNKISQWFSEQLQMNCRLVSFPENNPRAVDPKYSVNNEHVSLADAYPFLIIGQSSLDDLNKRLDEPVPMNRFRPNFVFTGGEPYEEESWREFKIGQNKFVGVKPCARCVLTTVNQDTAEKGVEPLLTLSGYRKVNNKVLFGQNLVALDHTTVQVGDAIIVN
jgi:uncharacterized protein